MSKIDRKAIKKAIKEGTKRLYTQNLAIKPGEKILIFTDRVNPAERMSREQLEKREMLIDLVQLMVDMAPPDVHVIEVIFDATGAHGKEPSEALWMAAFGTDVVKKIKQEGLWETLLAKSLGPNESERIEKIILNGDTQKLDAVIALSFFSTSHTKFRELLTGLIKVRYASMPIFDYEMFATTMTADWKKVAERTEKIARLFRSAEETRIEAPNGTDLIMRIKDAPVYKDTGLLVEPGSFGNLPAGEVCLSPLPGTTSGKLVLEWAPTWRLSTPVVLDVRQGEVIGVLGQDPYAKDLENFLEQDPDYRNIAELGIGTNDKASRPDNILESEKILGSIHVALGDNSSFGGNVRTSFHQDFVVFHPTLTLLYPGGEKKIVLDRGQLNDECTH